MTKISLNPLVCPECHAKGTKVEGNYYTDKDEIVRVRRCRNCDHRFTTIQECEVPIDLSQWQVKYPSYGSQKHARKMVKVEQIKRWVA
jgi:transcriptional regulator NrdR family protein